MDLMQRIVLRDWMQLTYEEKYLQIEKLLELRTSSLEQSRLVKDTKKAITSKVVPKKLSKDPVKDLRKTLDKLPLEVRAALMEQLNK